MFYSVVHINSCDTSYWFSHWWSQARPGQVIQFTLHDYGVAASIREGSVCQAYAIIRERDASRSETVCNGKDRMREVYTSTGHVVEVRVMTSSQSGDGRHFLLEYKGQ